MQTRLLHHVSPSYLTSITERDSLSDCDISENRRKSLEWLLMRLLMPFNDNDNNEFIVTLATWEILIF